MAHISDERELEETRDGTEPPPLLLGDRARAVRAAGISDLEPEWASDAAYARAQIDRLEVPCVKDSGLPYASTAPSRRSCTARWSPYPRVGDRRLT